MSKSATAKDVLYALEYLGDTLERISIRDGRHKWQMAKSGMSVSDRVADEVRSSSSVSVFAHHAKQSISFKRQ